MGCSPPGSSVHGILQARTLEWVAMPAFRRSSWPRDRTQISCIGRQILYHWATWEALICFRGIKKSSSERAIMAVKWQCMYMSQAPGTEWHRIRQRFFFSSFSASFFFFVVVWVLLNISQHSRKTQMAPRGVLRFIPPVGRLTCRLDRLPKPRGFSLSVRTYAGGFLIPGWDLRRVIVSPLSRPSCSSMETPLTGLSEPASSEVGCSSRASWWK